MIWTTLLIPVGLTIYLIFFHRKNIAFWEISLPFLATILITIIIQLLSNVLTAREIEYYGSSVKQINYYEDWNEWIDATCYETKTYRNSDGTTYTKEVPYDCSYSDYHSKYYTAVTTTKEVFNISEMDYKNIVNKFKTKEVFINMKRDYYTNDGDKYECYWSKLRKTHVPATTSHIYINKVRNSDINMFNMRKIDEDEAIKIGIYEYPRLRDQLSYSPILGSYSLPKTKESIYYLNSSLGSKKQVRLWLLIYTDKPETVAKDQESYWIRGNKNEIVITMSINSKTKEVDWVYPFSWSMIPSAEIREEIMEMKKLDDKKLALFIDTYLYNWINSSFDRREFKEFDYLKPKQSVFFIILAFILVIMFNVLIGMFWVVTNKFNNLK